MATDDPRVAVLAHGTGSTGEFVARAFGPALAEAGWDLVTLEDRSGSVGQVEDGIARAVDVTGARLVGGVSLGAHAAARWAARRPDPGPVGLLLVLPAWTGAPGVVAAASAAAADDVESLGPERAMASARDGSWVGEELALAWPAYGSGLASALRTTATQPGPTREELHGLTVPAGVVGLHHDPFHPVEVARDWVRWIPTASLEILGAQDPADDVGCLGRAAVRAWRHATGLSVRQSRDPASGSR